MLTDWIPWLSSAGQHNRFWLALAPVLLLDVPRYALGSVVMLLLDLGRGIIETLTGSRRDPHYSYRPSVCVVIAGFNEATTIADTLRTIWGTYPLLEIIVVDDGGTDGMANIAREFARQHAGVLLLRRPRRGGKSSALNYALPFTRAEIIVCVDADSHLAPSAIWEIIQPFADPQVGAVSGNLQARDPFINFVTWFQALEYLRCIFMGRQVASRLWLLGIVSGAFGAYRRSALSNTKGWDVGPGEDGDLTLRLRKAKFKIAFAPYAQSYTSLPQSWMQLLRQRRRWEWAAVTFECRKHCDMASLTSRNFQLSNLIVVLDRWFFNIVMVYVLWAYVIWLAFQPSATTWKLVLLSFAAYLVMEFVQLGVTLCYSTQRCRDAAIGLVLPLAPFYQLLLKAVSLVAITEELLLRRSFRDDFVPAHVRSVTWHW